MNILRKSSENEMISIFLKAEIDSNRWNGFICAFLNAQKLSESIIRNPNITDSTENKIRLDILDSYRNYFKRSDFFEGFPEDVDWSLAELTNTEIKQIKYINYDYWNLLSNNTRSPVRAVEQIKQGVEIYNQPNDSYITLCDEIDGGLEMLPLILVSDNIENHLVAVEGHLRLTAYCLAKNQEQKIYKAIIGIHSQINNWCCY